MLKQLLCDDNLKVMQSFSDDYIDLIYLDPPFNTGKDRAAFDDRWNNGCVNIDSLPVSVQSVCHTAALTHGETMRAYLSFMSLRLFEMKRILKDTGSIYLHVDPTASHYLKVLMDSIFGKDNFRNEIVWCYKGPGITS